MENYITYGLIHFIAWPFIIVVAYFWIKWAIQKYGPVLENE